MTATKSATNCSSPELSANPPTLPGAHGALALLLFINLFNYLDRQVLAAVVPEIRQTFFNSPRDSSSPLGGFLSWFQTAFGFKPENALIGLLSMAFMVSYMLCAPIFGRMAEAHSRWLLIGLGVILWSFASGATGLAESFLMLLLTRCFVGVGEAAYGPIAPTVISDFYPIQKRGQVLAWFYMAIPVGSALGFIFGEQMAHAFGWRWAFYSVVLPGIALGLFALFKKEPARGQSDLAQELGGVAFLLEGIGAVRQPHQLDARSTKFPLLALARRGHQRPFHRTGGVVDHMEGQTVDPFIGGQDRHRGRGAAGHHHGSGHVATADRPAG